jgi:hypothetical protein
MASTYSSLKIQLMATGENVAIWGNTTNVNLGTALEEAIVGTASVTFSSGNVTLTLTDVNTSQTARHLRLNLTGTTGGARDLIVPAIEKPYVVHNGCADAVTVKNATGTGIAVPAGKTMWVYNDGTNVLDVATHLTTLTLGSALPVASGGTGVTTSTGTGSVVLSTSPALTTPNIGVPSFATLTNATGLPISTGVSGLGTNVATFLATPSSANLAAAVTDETGSGLLVFATSPVLTTPNLGTPSAVVLTNASGLNLANTSATTANALPVSRGGTGVTASTGSGSVVLNTSPVLATPDLGTPSAVVLTNASGLNLANTSATTAQALPASRGGTGLTALGTGVATFLGTPSSANLAAAVTDETGSGLLVFATSPVLTTPNLGTPSAVVLTNASGLNLANTSATTANALPLTRGGTGGTSQSTAMANILPSPTGSPGGILRVNSSGTAWEVIKQAMVNFTVSATVVTNRGSTNVTSVSRANIGEYVVSVTNAMSNAYSAVAVNGWYGTGTNALTVSVLQTSGTSFVMYFENDAGAAIDPAGASFWVQDIP